MLHKDLKIAESKIAGKGIIATAFIPKNAIIWKLDSNETQFSLDELNKLPKKQRELAYQYKDKFIIATDGSEFMNHRCEPNTGWQDDETLIATKDIQPGEEVTYDYATAETNPEFRAEWACCCNSVNCRKIISGDDLVKYPKFTKKYEGLLPSWTVAYVKKHSGDNIYKAGGVLLKDKKFLVQKDYEKEFYIAPGGTIIKGETAKQALIRELEEEIQIAVLETDLEEFGSFTAKAAGNEGRTVYMDVFIVHKWKGEIKPNREVEAIKWIDSSFIGKLKIGSIFEHDVLPRLKAKGLIN
jgi:8-oxo-dGTP pyrophosphatase MutT (NUDIX family)